MTATAARAATPVDRLAEEYLTALAELDPIMATTNGVTGYDDRMPDLSPDGHAARAELTQRTLAGLDGTAPADETDRVTVAALRERLDVLAQMYELGMPQSELNNIVSPVQDVRAVFDLLPTDTVADWTVVARRLAAVPAALDGYVESLRQSATQGNVAPRRQVQACIVQSEANLGEDGFFATFVDRAGNAGEPVPDTLRADLDRGAHAAQAGYQRLRDFLADELLAQAPADDAIGRERYAPLSRLFLGAEIDLAETYEWGQQELARIAELMRQTADRISPGASITEAIALLDRDPARMLNGTDALQRWMQQRADEAIEALNGDHFDIPDQVRRLECRIAPTNTGVIYYTNPSDDFTRPGRMWWSVPAGVTEFSTWRELTTVYHEGVPGHHLQIGQAIYNRAELNGWRRLGCFVSGHGEGWALYSEWLMADLGYMDDPGNRMGLLAGQSLRAARVVIDVGVHCGFPAPAEVGGGQWTYDKAWQLLTSHGFMSIEVLRFELERYLGWPGQAPSYKLGEKLWLELRDECKARAGAGFDLKEFHRRALNLGSLGLDVLRRAVLNEL
ncbi:MAG TPA: DUF885 domain-containing protein [Jatrophihabitans sp.]|nr:DUF885 domain-containing protein [Jatrophihabitans sp.]